MVKPVTPDMARMLLLEAMPVYVKPSSTVYLKVYVYTADRIPVPNATLTVIVLDEHDREVARYVSKTDGSGVALLALKPDGSSGRYKIIVRAEEAGIANSTEIKVLLPPTCKPAPAPVLTPDMIALITTAAVLVAVVLLLALVRIHRTRTTS